MNTPDDNRTPEELERESTAVGRQERADPQDRAAKPDPKAGLDREVGDLEDPDAEDAGALPGRAGGGLAGV